MNTYVLIVALVGAGFTLLVLLIRWLRKESRDAAEAQQRAAALDSNLEDARDAEKHLDAPLTLRQRIDRARRRRLRRQRAAAGLEDSPSSAGDDG